jgi:hypothetical protein
MLLLQIIYILFFVYKWNYINLISMLNKKMEVIL